jgi:antirestriction protein ArdC
MAQRRTGMDVASIVTSRILEKMAQGNIPWKKPWKDMSLPRNYVSDREYTGVNQFLLAAMGRSSPYWLTKNQILDIAAKEGVYEETRSYTGEVIHSQGTYPLLDNAESQIVVFWKPMEKKVEERDTDGKLRMVTKRRAILRYYTVFNLDDTIGIPKKAVEARQHDPVEEGEAFITNAIQNGLSLKHGGDRAFYNPRADYVQLPNRESFENIEDYYKVFGHEAVHWTGGEKRMNREGIRSGYFGDKVYSHEELIAEFGAAFIAAHLGIDNEESEENSAAYIQSWSQFLKDNSQAVIRASGEAQKAVAWLTYDKSNSLRSFMAADSESD